MSRPLIVLAIVALVLPAAVAFADTITIDGSSADWYTELGNPGSVIQKLYDTPDPGEEPIAPGYFPTVPGYNIEYNWQFWNDDPELGYKNNMWFGMEFEGYFDVTYPKITSSDFAYLLFDIDLGSGGVLNGWNGVDYYAYWNTDSLVPTTVALWKYDPLNPLANAQGYALTGKRLDIAANTGASPTKWFIEAGMRSEWFFGTGVDIPTDGSWGWAAYYDNGNSPADDACPGIGRYNEIPEPGTLAMFGLGLFSLVAIRRRKAA